jgi:hypothetical protein
VQDKCRTRKKMGVGDVGCDWPLAVRRSSRNELRLNFRRLRRDASVLRQVHAEQVSLFRSALVCGVARNRPAWPFSIIHVEQEHFGAALRKHVRPGHIEPVLRYIDGDTDAQRKLVAMI